jgi:NADP-reducing hydrogenase subunit HndB
MANKIKSWDELKTLRTKAQADALGSESDWVVAVGVATCGSAAGGDDVMNVLHESIAKEGLSNVKVVSTGCFGNCYAEPVVEVRRANVAAGSGVRYGHVDAARAKEIVEKHLKHGEVIAEAIVGQEQEVYIV